MPNSVDGSVCKPRCFSYTGVTFDEWMAQQYETLWPDLFEPAVVEPAVDFLAGLAGTGPAL